MSNRKQLEQLFRKHYRRMYRMACLLLHDDMESKDAVHDVFASLLESGQLLREETAETYLLASVRNRCLNRMRGMKIRERVEKGYIIDQEAVSHTDPTAMEEAFAAMERGMELLCPPQCRDVLMMHYRDRRTFREIARQLQVSETTVYKYLRSALRQLREQLKSM